MIKLRKQLKSTGKLQSHNEDIKSHHYIIARGIDLLRHVQNMIGTSVASSRRSIPAKEKIIKKTDSHIAIPSVLSCDNLVGQSRPTASPSIPSSPSIPTAAINNYKPLSELPPTPGAADDSILRPKMPMTRLRRESSSSRVTQRSDSSNGNLCISISPAMLSSDANNNNNNNNSGSENSLSLSSNSVPLQADGDDVAPVPLSHALRATAATTTISTQLQSQAQQSIQTPQTTSVSSALVDDALPVSIRARKTSENKVGRAFVSLMNLLATDKDKDKDKDQK
eukprot:TRINITY_DN446_c2_g1_i1.p1 TRINITY_DN446_c2_g1~~TRINITY_DN446_c2_g1_i1.p1  ORF type:complete len:281 (-),score=71.58 TRINITY_DN446_c2_g1_i1:116-958(-)